MASPRLSITICCACGDKYTKGVQAEGESTAQKRGERNAEGLPAARQPIPALPLPLMPCLRLGGDVGHVFAQAEGAVEGGLRGDEGGQACGQRTGRRAAAAGWSVRVPGGSASCNSCGTARRCKAGLCKQGASNKQGSQRHRVPSPVAPMLLPTLARLAMSRKCCGASGVRNSKLLGGKEGGMLWASVCRQHFAVRQLHSPECCTQALTSRLNPVNQKPPT